MFEGGNNALRNGAWSHVGNNANEFANLSRPNYETDYNPSSVQTESDSTCGNAQTYTVTWVKKLADWDHQHSNGSKVGVYRSFGQIDSVVIEMKINSDKTSVPSKAQQQSLYGSILSASELNQLDNGKVAFAVSLVSGDGASATRGEVYLELDQNALADQWIRVRIPAENMRYWTGEEWAKQDLQLSSLQGVQIQDLFFNPETRGNDPDVYGNVVRNFTYPDWPMPTEDFKELNISIKKFEIRLK